MMKTTQTIYCGDQMVRIELIINEYQLMRLLAQRALTNCSKTTALMRGVIKLKVLSEKPALPDNA